MTAAEQWSALVAIVAAVIGAIGGAIPAFILARRASRETLRRDKAQRVANERALALRTHAKLIGFVQSVLPLKRHLDEMLDPARMPGAEPWQMLEPMIGLGSEYETRFDAEEIAVLLAGDRGELAQEIMTLAKRHAVHALVMTAFVERKAQLRRDLPPPENVTGTLATTALTREQVMRLRPQMIELNSLATQLHEYLREDARSVIELCDAYGQFARTYFADPRFPIITIDNRVRAMMGAPTVAATED